MGPVNFAVLSKKALKSHRSCRTNTQTICLMIVEMSGWGGWNLAKECPRVCVSRVIFNPRGFVMDHAQTQELAAQTVVQLRNMMAETNPSEFPSPRLH